jgi:hypothetical protein
MTNGTNGTVMALPLHLRANDIKKHILSIDSRFRQQPTTSSSSDYYYQLVTPIKNVLRIRMTSLEFPNNYPFFCSARSNITFRVLYMSGGYARTAVITIRDGNYTAADMTAEITTVLQTVGLPWLNVTFDFFTGKFTFTGNTYFGIDTMYSSIDRPFDYGLGYYLGFGRELYKAVTDASGTYVLHSPLCASFNGDNYIFIKINDYECVQHTTDTTDVRALAKVILRDPKTYVAFDDYASEHAKEVVFKAPQNISRLHIRIVDPYGDDIELVGTNHSFSLEILEILNLSLYNSIRESLATRYS